MRNILIIDPLLVTRDALAKSLQQSGYRAWGVCNLAGALGVMSRERIDAVIADPSVSPDRGRVLQILADVVRPRRMPLIIYTTAASRADVAVASRVGIKDYLLKTSLTADQVVERVGRRLREGADAVPPKQSTRRPEVSPQTPSSPALAARHTLARDFSQLTPALSREEVLTRIDQGVQLRSLAPVVHSVIALTQSSQCSAEDVAKCLRQDQALCVKLLRLANGSAYSRGRIIDSLKMAVSRIGIREVRNLAMGLSVIQQYETTAAHALDPRLFWEHSIACGVIASSIARACKDNDSDDYFLLGLLHDVGRMVMVEHLADQYTHLCKQALRLGTPLEVLESKLFMVDHCKVLQRVLQQWQFPTDFIAPLVHHHAPLPKLQALGGKQARQGMIIALADRLAHALLLGDSGNHMLYPYSEFVDALGLEPSAIAEIIATAPAETMSMKYSILAHADQTHWPECSASFRQALKVSVRPCFAGLARPLNPWALFFEKLADEDWTVPNIAILSVTDSRDFGAHLEELQRAERDRGVDNLPIIVFAERGALQAEHPYLHTRAHAMLRSPVPIYTLIEHCNRLLCDKSTAVSQRSVKSSFQC